LREVAVADVDVEDTVEVSGVDVADVMAGELDVESDGDDIAKIMIIMNI
jgi:hypothetical protein